MKIEAISAVSFANVVKETKDKKNDVSKTQQLRQQMAQNIAKPSGELLNAVYGIRVGKPAPKKYTYQEAKQEIDKNPLFAKVNPKHFKNIKKVMTKGDEETSNVQMQLEMINKGLLEPSTISHYWETGKMSTALAEDLDMMYEADKAGKNINDVYVPEFSSQKDGNASGKIGDVFKVADQDKIYLKTSDTESKQLDMDKDMFIKLFPPAKRFTTQQQSIGDCYLVSTLNTVLENPKSRIALYEAIHQDGKDVTVKFKNGNGEYKYQNAELPADRIQKYSLKGAMGIRILEDAYGLDSVDKADKDFRTVMGAKIAEKEAKLATASEDEKAEISKSLEGHKQRLNDYIEAKADSSRTIVVCRDDNDFNIYYEEDEYGMKFADLSDDPDNTKKEFEKPADFYRGSLGGYNFEVMERLGFGGFRQLNLDYAPDREQAKDMMMNFNSDYIMTGGTRSDGSKVENPVAEKAGVYGWHAYSLKPHKDEKGNLTITCTNPWNTSYDADVKYSDFLSYYDSVSIIDINSYGKDLPLENQPVQYDKDGAVIGNNENDGAVLWFSNASRNHENPQVKSA